MNESSLNTQFNVLGGVIPKGSEYKFKIGNEKIGCFLYPGYHCTKKYE